VRDETGYEIERTEQRERRLGRDGRLSRRELLALAAAPAPVLAGGRLAWPASTRAAGPIV